jgi:hypothetical protein
LQGKNAHGIIKTRDFPLSLSAGYPAAVLLGQFYGRSPRIPSTTIPYETGGRAGIFSARLQRRRNKWGKSMF